MSCKECDRIVKYMAADPEMYRGEDTRCSAHRRVSELAAENAALRAEIEEKNRELANSRKASP